ncbi:MAG: 5'-nucleotidase C-terminal domain-containing protein [gamma proteobacterium symbiont of Bathyaustriella thionipta]|nr:5'-nucleotidase C-terminal domain-containing protein [gamma proteobacterium symbiont of Bathyaustriella thionipta]MCU7949823.1 5'-nucleotidase C-terminal domain-containing protein [gamma proteobacterium symbiont of Bathyaustriella thionipta]MCU7952689.1 5'-nucleotidase C-terminal domain-containing protein [gamma proteobacterium symbiont of Bathyaustriella thionipta]MCU7956567.1 5'-nucleotidase C-terminal domain-containing protein [gamma proteobacterium symbiont of Bathyaustriella thionipta]M
MAVSRRNFVKVMGIAGTATTIPALLPLNAVSKSSENKPNDFYSIPMKGNARILHITDVHGQLNPVYFREPNVNLGVGDAYGRPPHVVGTKLLAKMDLKANSPEAYAYTYLNFENVAKIYGKTGGFAHIKTLLDRLREQAGGKKNTLSIDGGDLWQGSGTSLWTRGVDMVEASNIMGLDVMVGHWEFTYREEEVLSNVALFKGDFIGQNVRVKEDALMSDEYPAMVERFDGSGLYDEDSGHAFRPYVIKEINGARICIIGQAFPRTANANPQEFFPDWSFGLREDDMIELVAQIRADEKPDAIILLSHNGMDVDIKMAQNVPGLNAVFGGHTHDGMPKPVEVKNVEGGTCLVTNAGSNGKYIGVMDFDIQKGKIKAMHYQMLPIISDWLPADKEMAAYIKQMRQTKYDDKIVESRASKHFFNKSRVGKTYEEILNEKLAIADRLLYRRGNFMGTWDQVLCNALRHEYKADVAMSAGVRWGTTTLKGDWITMEDVMTQCAMTYGETYVSEMKGKDLMNILEGVADNLFDPDPYLQSGGDMVRIGGLDYTIDPDKPIYQRITNARLDNGHLIEPEETYKVAGWASVNRTPEGRLMWDVVHDYIISQRSKDKILRLPKINHPKLLGVTKNPGIADYPGELG